MKLKFLVFVIILSSCSTEKRNLNISDFLTEENSVWVFSNQDIANPKNIRTARLAFESNGIFHEKGSDEKFVWQYNSAKNKLIIKRQEYDILKADAYRIYLRNARYHNEAKLYKERD